MKKILITVLTAIMLTGCSSAPTVKDTTPAPTPTTTAATQTTETKAPETQPTTTAAPVSEAGLGKTIVFKDFEITFKEVVRSKTYDNKEGVRLIYDFKNLSEEAQAPMFLANITVYQKGVELSNLSIFEDTNDNGMKKIKKGAVLEDVLSDHVAEPADGELTIEVKPLISFDKKEVAEFTVDYPAE